MPSHHQTDFLIIGGGIIGLTTALQLKSEHPDCSITVLEKESRVGMHASSRNSGVLHAGFYYTADSLKARLTQAGNRELGEYCRLNNIPVNHCGKLVVTKNEKELNGLRELYHRGQVNEVPLELVSAKEATEIEPRVRTVEQALFSPTTATVNPSEVMAALHRDAESKGINIITNSRFESCDGRRVQTGAGDVETGYIVNTAGLYADKIARHFGFSDHYTILPFKGLYLYGSAMAGKLNCNIYPVPEVNNPFLGVHFTVTVDNRIKIGPTATPAFWREHYNGLENFNIGEFAKIALTESALFIKNHINFRDLAVTEFKKSFRKNLVNLAADMVAGIDNESFDTWGRPGIRAQLLDTRDHSLVMDFCHEGDDRSFHVLNSVSPAFTCAFPLSRMITAEIRRLTG